ncbi:MAG TPA: 3-hydroxyacyl-ACP dehydratase FabZ [Alphaproteobacteria bacterium]|nr:3-hydroxyacyl-ACP dehydratase FabZ [Alphaproteobacteria bacterium]
MTVDARQIVEQPPSSLDITQLMKMLPHRYPMLMVDRLEEIVVDHSAVGIKNVSVNEPCFQGHFPEKPIMPGVLIIESMAQTAAALVVLSLGGTSEGKLVYFMSIEDARFRKLVMPGDTLRVHVEKIHKRGNVWKFRGEARVGGVLCAEAVYTAMIVDQ